ncbi:transcriptional regulator, Crp/Fnr family [Pelagirhabdus alkalitolerans]|uniref:Transcriptional regulator, Crp/Fnr family n=1 Tax=Pelagirhabdus alkalitolerans TaxID=1612202 RepID=A0A1G6KC75_9BACI|nr:Crp/Fnr family transcriptional regulator [Pelagirhabdus alkalitolerans]SDC28564.1 transcriptional regulator, Crp/Fnr family [Pelagirhabdus alkalitolerans]
MGRHIQINQLPAALKPYFQEPDYYIETRKNTFLFRQGEEANELYVILSGHLTINKASPDGRELTLRYCGEGDLVGELAIDEESTSYLVDGKITEAGKVAIFGQKKLKTAMEKDTEAYLAFIKMANLNYRKDQTKFRDLILHGKKGALYSTLIRLSNSYGKKQSDGIHLTVQLTNQEIANFCATSRESVNRMINELRRLNVVSIQDGKLCIHDLEYLKTSINCEDCPVVLCTIN